MYTEAELRVLAAAQGEPTVSALAEELDRSVNYVSELLDQMEEKGLVHTTRSGKTKHVHRSSARAIELYDQFVQRYPHIPFAELLGGATLRVLYHLATPASPTDLAEQAGVHRSTVYRSLSPLQHRGLVYRDDGRFALNDEFEGLARLAHEFAHHRNRNRTEEHADTYTILWESLDEFLVQTDELIGTSAFHITGPEKFQAFELPLLARKRRYYLYSESTNEISPEELCCHMLVIGDDTRSRSYCLLLLGEVDVDRDDLLDIATTYGVEDDVRALLEYLDTDGETRTEKLPTWDEFRDLADEYGVAV
ncbi:helix-turn-helix domain-containing protein [Halorubrum ruber]|uniref:Helix-turn-helix domain-containing protein n=1 Tax=Halorubrum ruber TaxID=2982524 RepID=A0A8T8LKR5_9EURY|nr:helix-turn-helix domain-containing protein [Halorubrum ruber]QUO47673.1 helix-turn-helix domain-containing protein [Halorubrum ruber]